MPEHLPEFSVILPVYNVEKYLKECLESLICQTFENLEFICVDDNSTDNSLEILNSFAQNDFRFKIITKENEGAGVARNCALDLAKGKYIAFVDPDDIVEKNAFEALDDFIRKDEPDVVQFDYFEFDEKKIKERNFKKTIYKNSKFKLKSGGFYNYKDVKNGCLINLDRHVWTRIYKKSFVDKNKLRFAATRTSEDHLFANGAILLADKIYYLEKYLYKYRVREGSLMNCKKPSSMEILDVVKTQEDFLEEKNLKNELNAEFSKYKIHTLGGYFELIPNDLISTYLQKSKELLSEAEYKAFLHKIKKKKRLIENIFSLKNRKNDEGKKEKILTLLGAEFKL